MDVQEFVYQSIKQIVDASKQLNSELNPDGVKIAAEIVTGGINRSTFTKPEVINVSFDLSVIVDESSEKKGEAGLKVASLFKAGGDISQQKESQSISRIHFDIPVTMPRVK